MSCWKMRGSVSCVLIVFFSHHHVHDGDDGLGHQVGAALRLRRVVEGAHGQLQRSRVVSLKMHQSDISVQTMKGTL